jgi:hypothetical protein
MKEDYITRISKKIRNQLIYYTYTELKKNSKKNHYLLINSMTPNMLSEKYQKCSDYCVEKIEEYSNNATNNGINNNNYFHVSVTYCSVSNNYHMLVDNKNIDQYLGQNNIVGKYYKGNNIQIRTTTDKYKYNICMNENQNKLEKKVIGQKKFKKQNRSVSSSLDVTKNIYIKDIENINDINDQINNLNSNFDEPYHKKLINQQINNEKMQTNCGNKIHKSNTQKAINLYMLKLKNYCSTLKLIKRKANRKNTMEPRITKEPQSPKRKFKDKNMFRSGKEKPIIEEPSIILHSFAEFNFNKQNQNQNLLNSKIASDNKNIYSIRGKLKSQTKIGQASHKLQAKPSFHKKNRAISIDKNEEKSNSPKKIYSPKKGNNAFELNSGQGIGSSKFFIKKEKNSEEEYIKKYTSGNKIDFPNNKKKKNHMNVNSNNKLNENNEKQASNHFRANNNKDVKKLTLKKSLTINKMYKFRAGEVLEKKIGSIRIKKNNNKF